MDLEAVLSIKDDLNLAVSEWKEDPDVRPLLEEAIHQGSLFADAVRIYTKGDVSKLADILKPKQIDRVAHVNATFYNGVPSLIDKKTIPIGTIFVENGIRYITADMDLINSTLNMGSDRYIMVDGDPFTLGASINRFYTGQITDFSGLFENDEEFNANISYWDTSSAVNMDRMFKGAKYFNRNLSRWDVSNVTSNIDFDTDTMEWVAPKPNFV